MKYKSLVVCISFLGLSCLANADVAGLSQAPDVNGPTPFMIFDDSGMYHDAAGDEVLLFFARSMSEKHGPSFAIYRRSNHKFVGEIPAPPSGPWNFPFLFRLGEYQSHGAATTQGVVYLMDSISPTMVGQAIVRVVAYTYSYHPAIGLQTTLLWEEAVPMDNPVTPYILEGTIFPTSMEVMENGDIVIADTFSGALWVFEKANPIGQQWRVAFMHPDFSLIPFPVDETIEVNGVEMAGYMNRTFDENGELVELPYSMLAFPGFPNGVIPGLHAVAYIPHLDSFAFTDTALGPIAMISRSLLFDNNVPPFAKPYETLVPSWPGVTDWVGEVIYDVFYERANGTPSKWLYWHRAVASDFATYVPPELGALNAPLFRVHLETGEVQIVTQSWQMFDIPSCTNVIPCGLGDGSRGKTCILDSNVYQERTCATNYALYDEYGQCTDILLDQVLVPITVVGE